MAKTTRIAPPPCVYAVIQMEPTSMVKNLGLEDLETLSKVGKMNPKKYLVLLYPIGPVVLNIATNHL